MKKKNGFFAISIIFSFFIVFLMLITMNLTRYAQNRILLAQVKKDIKANSKIEIKNHTLICKRADITTLHTSYCGGTGCKSAGVSEDTMMVYGNEYTANNTIATNGTGVKAAVSGTLNAGDAFDCDVNGDGTYDSTTERFYLAIYDIEYLTFIYSNNIINGAINNTGGTAFSTTSNGYNSGPDKAKQSLPSINAWKNVKLVNQTRNIMDQSGTVRKTGFSYSGYAARLLSYQELQLILNGRHLKDVWWLMENTRFDNESLNIGYWIETVYSASSSSAYFLNASSLPSFTYSLVTNTAYGVRPVIEVPKDRVEVNFKEAN